MGVKSWGGEVEYVGRTVKYAPSIQVMSDVWESGAWVLTEDGRLIDVVGAATVDATPEVYEAVVALDAERKYNSLRFAEHRRYVEAKNDLFAVEKGKRVKVVRGRKVPLGTTGTVIWVGDTKFGTRVGLKDEAGEVYWTALSNVEVIDIDPDDIPLEGDFAEPEDVLRAEARARAEREWLPKDYAKAA